MRLFAVRAIEGKEAVGLWAADIDHEDPRDISTELSDLIDAVADPATCEWFELKLQGSRAGPVEALIVWPTRSAPTMGIRISDVNRDEDHPHRASCLKDAECEDG